jgi:hypothetical protein
MDQLTEILKKLLDAKVEFSLIGGFAARQYGVSFVTDDLDICARFTFQNLKRIESALDGLHPRHRLVANRLPLELTEDVCSRLKNMYIETDIGILDCLSNVAGVGDFEQVMKESEITGFPFGQCHVLKIESLIRAKEAVGRHHDLLTVRQLRAIEERRKISGTQLFIPLT